MAGASSVADAADNGLDADRSNSCPGERRTPQALDAAGRAPQWSSTLSPVGLYRQSRVAGSL